MLAVTVVEHREYARLGEKYVLQVGSFLSLVFAQEELTAYFVSHDVIFLYRCQQHNPTPSAILQAWSVWCSCILRRRFGILFPLIQGLTSGL